MDRTAWIGPPGSDRLHRRVERQAHVAELLEALLQQRLGVQRPELVGYAQVLSLSAGLVLLVSCLNVVVLLLLRTMERSRELAVRQVLGARRRRLALQVGGENLLLFARPEEQSGRPGPRADAPG